MPRARSLVLSILALVALPALLVVAGCGKADPETRALVVVSGLAGPDVETLAARFTERSGRAVSVESFDAKRGLPKRFDVALLEESAAPFAQADPQVLAELHAWPLARAGEAAHHEEGRWVGVARRGEGLLAAGVSATSDLEGEARDFVAFLLSDESQRALDEAEGLDALVEP